MKSGNFLKSRPVLEPSGLNKAVKNQKGNYRVSLVVMRKTRQNESARTKLVEI